MNRSDRVRSPATPQNRYRTFISVDLGASNGRVTAARFDGQTVRLEEVTRFLNEPVTVDGSLRWDAPRLFELVTAGISQAVAIYPAEVVSVAVSGWGVDFGLIDNAGALLALPYSYRDTRTASTPSRVFQRFSEYEWYKATGVATMPINTLFQLAWAVENDPETLSRAAHALLIPDLVGRHLSGEPVTERTIASTTQMLDVRDATWRRDELAALGIPDAILTDPVPAGTIVAGPDSPIAKAVEVPLSVVTAASHDTASAFIGSGAGPGDAILSSGTWALLGVQGPLAHTSDAAYAAGFTNELCADGRTRTLRNLTGLWIIQECVRSWSATSGDLSFETLAAEAAQARPFIAVVDTNDPRFATPGDMPAKIAQFCRDTAQDVPQTRGELIRVVLEGLALQFRNTLRTLENVTTTRVRGIRTVGGGARHRLLNQLTASATATPVAAGNPEATALGNALVQMVASGDLVDLAEAEDLAAAVAHETFDPADERPWSEAEQKLQAMGE